MWEWETFKTNLSMFYIFSISSQSVGNVFCSSIIPKGQLPTNIFKIACLCLSEASIFFAVNVAFALTHQRSRQLRPLCGVAIEIAYRTLYCLLTDTLLCVDHQQQVILKSIKLSDATRLIDCCRIAAALIPWCEAQKFHVHQLACDNWILLREVIQTICINNTGNTAAVQTLRGQISICFQCWSVHAWLALQKKHIRYHFLSFQKLSLLSYQILNIVMSVHGYRIYNCFVILT